MVTGPLHISEVVFAAATAEEVETGLVGYVSAVLNGGLKLDGLALRRTSAGRLTLSYPSRADAAGKKRFYLKPLTDDVRRDLEHQVLVALGVEEATQG